MTAIVTTDAVGAYINAVGRELPQHMNTIKRVAILRIGEATIKELRQNGLTKFKNRGKRVGQTFKRQTLDNDNILSIYSKWNGAGIHDAGGTITAKGKYLWVWLAGGLKKDGSRRFTDAQIDAELESGKMFFLKRVGRPTLVIRFAGKQKKDGSWGYGVRNTIVAVLRRSVRLNSRYSLAESHQRAAPAHERAMKKTLDEVIDTAKTLVDP